jgi:hypothetical protein
VAIEVDANARPVEARRHLLDVGRLAGAVIALDHHATVVLETGEDGEGNVLVEQVVRIEIRNVLFGLGVGGNVEIGVDAEDLTHRHLHIREAGGPGLSLRAHCR